MKQLINSILLLSIILSSCQRNNPEYTPVDETGRVPLVLRAEGIENFETKAGVTVTTTGNLDSFYATATTGTAGHESCAWESARFTRDGEVYTGDKYWPLNDPGYHFYASNCEQLFSTTGTVVAVTNDQDVVCAYLNTSSYKATNALTFKHIFARVGKVMVKEQQGYIVSDVSITITPYKSGYFNIRTGYDKTDGTGWGNLTLGESVELTSGRTGSKNNDLYLVPGRYTLKATWTATRGDYVETFTSKSAIVTLEGGKVSNLTTTLGGQAVAVQFSVSVVDWDSDSLTPVFPLS